MEYIKMGDASFSARYAQSVNESEFVQFYLDKVYFDKSEKERITLLKAVHKIANPKAKK